MFSNYSILNMKIHFLNSLKSRYMYSGNCKSPSRFQTCELQTSYWHFNLLYYTVNLDIKKEKKIHICMITVHFIVCFEKKVHLNIDRGVLYLSKFPFYISCSFKLRLIDVYPIFFSLKERSVVWSDSTWHPIEAKV